MEVFIVDDLDPASPKMGGVSVHSQMLLDYLGKVGIKTTLLGAGKSSRPYTRGDFTFIPVISKPEHSGYDYLFRLTMKTRRLKIPEGAIIHAQHPEYMLPFALFHPKNPKMLTIHGQVLRNIRLKRTKAVRLAYEKVEKFVLKRCDMIMVVDELTRAFYQRQYPWLERPVLVPTGIDLSRFRLLDRSALRAKYDFTPDDRVIAFVGRLEKEKGADFLLDCAALLEGMVPGAVTVLIGDGRDTDQLKSAASGLDLKRVRFMGAQDPEAIPGLMNCADVLALCSKNEGSPLVVKEALACGVPVVATAVGDVRKVLLNEKVGRVVRRNREDFAAALTSVLLDPDKEQTRAECSRVAAGFSFEAVGARTVGLYRELAARGKVSVR